MRDQLDSAPAAAPVPSTTSSQTGDTRSAEPWGRTLLPVLLPVAAIAIGLGVTRPIYVTYYAVFGLSLGDINGSARDLATSALVTAGLMMVLMSGLFVGVAVAGRWGTGADGQQRPQRTAATGSAFALGIIVAIFAVRGTDTRLLIIGPVATALMGFGIASAVAGFLRPHGLDTYASRVANTIAGFLTFAVIVSLVQGSWTTAPKLAKAIREDTPRPEVAYFEFLDVPVGIQTLSDDDPLGLCGPPATARLIARGNNYAYIVLRPATMPANASAPVVPVPNDNYVVFTTTEPATDDTPTDLCAAPISLTSRPAPAPRYLLAPVFVLCNPFSNATGECAR
jgi:hypothetical protein